jgi:hypothetical protein
MLLGFNCEVGKENYNQTPNQRKKNRWAWIEHVCKDTCATVMMIAMIGAHGFFLINPNNVTANKTAATAASVPTIVKPKR